MLSWPTQSKVAYGYSVISAESDPLIEPEQINLCSFLPSFYQPDNDSNLPALCQWGVAY